MNPSRRTFLLATVAYPVASALPAAAQAGYPSHAIRFIVPFAPGGSADSTARLVAESLQKALGHAVVVDNQAGASGIIGTQTAVRAAPDGYTLLFSTSSNQVIAPLLRQPRPYDPVKDFTAIASIAVYDGTIAVPVSLPVNTVAELVALSKARPGTMNYGSAGIGSTNHLATEQFKAQSGANLLHVPYKGSAASILAVAAGEVQMTIDTIASALPLVKAGRIKMLAVNTPIRSPAAPTVPTFKEAGVKEIANYWQGVCGPAGMPKAIVATLNRLINEALASPELKAQLAQIGATVTTGTAERFAANLAAESANWAEVIRVNHIQAD